MSLIKTELRLFDIGSWTILALPQSISDQFSSRNMLMAEGSINGFRFHAPLEPDGKGSHWFKIDQDILQKAKLHAVDRVKLDIQPSNHWPEPDLPTDITAALHSTPEILKLWAQLTTKARWEWLRWIRSTNNEITRKHRIEMALYKLKNGQKRPCCFNSRLCSEPSVSHSGVLLYPLDQGTLETHS